MANLHASLLRMKANADAYGESWAEFYDELYSAPTPDVVSFLRSRADDGPVLELAIGTGRVAMPLIESGIAVHGVEISPKMIDRLHRKDPSVPVVAADMTDFDVTSTYPLVLLGFNTLFGELEEEGQNGVFRSTSRALRSGGRFVLDCFVPDLSRFDRAQTVRTREITANRLLVDYSILDSETRRIRSMVEVRWTDGRSALLPVEVRYLWPREIDAMAGEAGLELEERYEWYDEAPFTDASPRHVSVYRKV